MGVLNSTLRRVSIGRMSKIQTTLTDFRIGHETVEGCRSYISRLEGQRAKRKLTKAKWRRFLSREDILPDHTNRASSESKAWDV